MGVCTSCAMFNLRCYFNDFSLDMCNLFASKNMLLFYSNGILLPTKKKKMMKQTFTIGFNQTKNIRHHFPLDIKHSIDEMFNNSDGCVDRHCFFNGVISFQTNEILSSRCRIASSND